MIYNEIKNPLRIYDDINKQDQHFKSDGKVFSRALISPSDTVPPFQFAVPVTASPEVTKWYLKYHHHGGSVPYNFLANIPLLEIKNTLNGLTYITYKASAPMITAGDTLDLEPAMYYMVLEVNGELYYSEVFQVCKSFSITDQVIPYLKFEYNNTGDDGVAGDLGEIMYQTGYKNILYLDTDVITEEPSIEEEGHEDGAKQFIRDLARYVENFSLDELMPFYLADAMMIMSMHKNVTMTLPYKLYSGKIRNMKATMKQQEVSNVYRLTFSFSQDSKYIDNACATKLEIFSGSTAVATAASGVSQGNILGTINFNWTITGSWHKVKIKHISRSGGVGSLVADKIVNAPAVSTTHTGFSNGTHQIDIIPITTFAGSDFEGTAKRIQVTVGGSAQA